jgi:hypothetical protein
LIPGSTNTVFEEFLQPQRCGFTITHTKFLLLGYTLLFSFAAVGMI